MHFRCLKLKCSAFHIEFPRHLILASLVLVSLKQFVLSSVLPPVLPMLESVALYRSSNSLEDEKCRSCSQGETNTATKRGPNFIVVSVSFCARGARARKEAKVRTTERRDAQQD